MLADTLIPINSPVARMVGFTSDKFTRDSYLWGKGTAIWISLITSRYDGKGNVRALMDSINAHGFTCVVPVPLARMQMICERMGFQRQPDPDCGEIWIRHPGGPGSGEAA